LRARVSRVARSPYTREARPPLAVDASEAEIVDLAAEALQEAIGPSTDEGSDEEGGPLNGSTVAEHHALQAILFDDDASNLAVDEADAAGFELLALRLRQVVGVRKEDQVVGPLADELCVLDRARAGAEPPSG
jgi:hypothetical protein